MRVIDARRVVVGDIIYTERRGGQQMEVTSIAGTTMLTFHGFRVDGPFKGAPMQLTRRTTSAVYLPDIPVIDVFGLDKEQG